MVKLQQDHNILTVDKARFSYGASMARSLAVVRDISFHIQQGEFLCFLGPSGCGKTTMLRLIAGLETLESGTITSNKDDFEVGMVFQDLALFPHMSAARNIAYALRHLPRPQRRARVDEMLALVGLSDKRASFPHELSGGQKQRLALARALARQPDLILLDEPFAAQDVTLRAHMRDDVMHILREAGVAAILVTHDPEEAMQFADRIAIMNEGRLQQIGTPSEIYNQPNSAFVASFFGQVNTLTGRVHKGCVDTPAGKIEAPDYQDNTPVKIIIRPEALKLSAHNPAIDHHDPNHAHQHAMVAERKYLGRSTLVHMDTHDFDNAKATKLHLHARVPGMFLDGQHDMQDIFLDQSQIFVFPDKSA